MRTDHVDLAAHGHHTGDRAASAQQQAHREFGKMGHFLVFRLGVHALVDSNAVKRIGLLPGMMGTTVNFTGGVFCVRPNV